MTATDTYLEREIREQPAAVERLVSLGASDAASIARELRGHDFQYAVIAARGSSDNAARYGQYLFGERMGLPVALAAPSLESLYSAGAVPRHGTAIVIGISQSGRSPDIVEVLATAAQAGTPTIAITNDEASPLARAAAFTLNLHTGSEHSIAATKTYTASLAALSVLVTELRNDEEGRSALQKIPVLLERALNHAFEAVEVIEQHTSAGHVVAIGRGYNYATALEIALKVRELTTTVAEGFSPADLMHGPIAAITRETLAIIIAAHGKALSSVLEAGAAVRTRGAQLLMIAEPPGADLALPRGIAEWLSPIVAVAPGQVLALRLARLGGHSIDAPVGLTKVTETY